MSNRRIRHSLSFLPLAAVLTATPAAAQMATGSYVGDGVAGRRIVGLGFRPNVVLVKADYTNVTPSLGFAVLRSSTMTGDNTKPLIDPTALTANLIQSLDGDGFTLGNAENVNGLGTCGGPCTYYWVAFKANADLKVGTYTGDGAPTQSITGLGFSPDYIITMPAVAKRALTRTSRGTNQSKRFESAVKTDGIVSMDANGFTVASAVLSNDDQNTNLTTYHYVAWNEAPGKVKVGEYTGDGSDDRNITGVGFQPEFVFVQKYSADREARFRTGDMVGDPSATFGNEVVQPDRIQALQPDGFQLGLHPDVNAPAGYCAGPSNCEYAWVAFNAHSGCCAALTTTDTGSVVTVTAPDNFELALERPRGGSIRAFYDLAEDPTRTQDLAGGIGSQDGLFIDEIQWTGNLQNHRSDKRPRARLRILEATPTRVQVRSESLYNQNNNYATEIPGIMAIGENTISATGRNALHWRRVTTSSVDTEMQQLHLNVHYQAAAPLNAWAGYTQSGAIPTVSGVGPADDDFVMLQIDQPFARTDFLEILYQDWVDAEQTWSNTTPGNEWLENTWIRNPPLNIPAGSNQVFNFLTYFKPTTFGSDTDPQVTGRHDDYRLPDDLASPSAFTSGGGWFDPNENTSSPSDFFNEAEAAYSLDFDPAAGLSFDIDGGTTTRYQPTFKIRQWRSLSAPATVTLENTTLVRGVDYQADVQPVSRSPFHRDLLWHSTLQDQASVDTDPDVGSAGSLAGVVTFEPARFGQGARTSLSGDWIAMPTLSNFDPAVGALSFWYRPNYDSNDNALHDICGVFFDANNRFVLEKRGDNNLYFVIVAGGAVSELQILWTDYHWAANDWIQIGLEWRDSAGVGGQQHVYLDDIEVAHTDPLVNYDAINLTVGAEFRFGNTDGDGFFAPGVYDEIEMVSGVTSVLASSGLVGSAGEWLADSTAGKNFTLNFTPVGADDRGKYLIFGGSDKFRGLNVGLATPGVGVPAGALEWEYWDGTSWANLESVAGFTDETLSFTRAGGSIYWTDDPPNWTPYSTFGGVEIYRIRVHLAPGFNYSTPPVEGLIKTDIVILQYCGDITANSQTFSFAPPIPTEVDLASFGARSLDGAIELTWETTSELRNLGFHLYRADSAEGPYARITTAVIPGLGSSPAGAQYLHLDRGLVNGRRYFYKLEDIETTGRTELHGPVSAVPAATAGDGGGSVDYGAPASTSIRVLERTARALVLELSTGGFRAEHLADGSVRLSIPGFTEELAPGTPAIPVKESWVEAISGRRVQLDSIREEQVVRFPSLRPAAAGAPEILASSRGTVRAGRRSRGEGAAFHGKGLFPDTAARILSEGYQGQQKKVQLRLAPLRWDRTTGDLLLAKRLVVRLVFSGREPEHREGGSHQRRSVAKRLSVRDRGLYGARFEQVMGARARPVPASSLRLTRLGDDASFHVEPDNGTFGTGSVLYFVSDGERLNPYEREAVYELELFGGGERMEIVDSRPEGSPVSLGFRKLEREENRYYQAGLMDAKDLWFWDSLLAPAEKSYSFEIHSLAAALEAPSRLTIWLQGATDFAGSPDHHLQVSVNGAPITETWLEGKKPLRLTTEVPPLVLREGENHLEITNTGGTDAPYSMVMLDRFELQYPTVTAALGGVWEAEVNLSGTVDLQGLDRNARIVDVSGKPRWLKGASASGTGLRFSVQAGQRVLAVSPQSILTPAVTSVAPSSLKTNFAQADYVVLGPKTFLDAARPLLKLRRSQGLTTRAVPLEEMYSEFGHGEKRPEAIRDFISFAYSHWKRPAPRYLLLLGDASYDFKDYLGTGVQNQLPALAVKTTYLWTASDPTYAAVHGEDLLPDIAIGRLPASSLAEVQVLVEKILTYEDRPERAAPFVFIADNRDGAGDFESDVAEIAATVPASRDTRMIFLSREGVDATRRAILDSFDRGASVTSYVGHGGIHLWAHENLFDIGQVGSLAPQREQPLVLTLNCLNGYFHFPYFNSLGEELVKAKGKGAIAVFSPTGLSLNEPAHVLHRALIDEIASGRHERLGDAVAAAQAAYATGGAYTELLQIYHLLGDPALLLR